MTRFGTGVSGRVECSRAEPSLDTRAAICYDCGMRSELLRKANCLVVKLGTGVLTDASKQPDFAQMEQLAAQIAEQRRAGREIVMVTSGAVGAGMGELGYKNRPRQLAQLQACAAVGQSRLMTAYEKFFAAHQLHTAQVLLTHEDLQDHERHLNARNTLVTLLKHGVVPIINENDAVSSTELKFGDNDRLSALVAALLPADLLVILTTVDGVIEDFGKAGARTIPMIEKIDARLEGMAGGTDSETAVGGMASKIQAAKIVVRSGIPLVIASGHKKNALARIMEGEQEGTIFLPQAGGLRGRKRWIAFFHHAKGTLFVDDGARAALVEKGRSLLPPGVTRCEGEFAVGDVLRICDRHGVEFARGIARFDSAAVRGRKLPKEELVHRDDLVIL